MKNQLFKYSFLLIIAALSVSCDKLTDPVQNQIQYLKIAEVVSSGSSFNVGFYATDSLFVGFNKVYFKVTGKSTGMAVSQATLSLHPLMNMGTYSHACPFENPESTLDADGFFEGAVIFSMIGTNSWSLSVDVSANGKSETALFPLEKVIITNPVKKIVVIDSLSTGPGTWTITKYPMSLIYPDKWKVGNNPFEITVHTMASMMSFPAATDLTIEIDPQMPSMGHGSPNNVNPVHSANGHYLGSVNFTMTGAWRIYMVIKKGTRVISNKAYFDITF
jgi:hypothetical protein